MVFVTLETFHTWARVAGLLAVRLLSVIRQGLATWIMLRIGLAAPGAVVRPIGRVLGKEPAQEALIGWKGVSPMYHRHNNSQQLLGHRSIKLALWRLPASEGPCRTRMRAFGTSCPGDISAPRSLQRRHVHSMSHLSKYIHTAFSPQQLSTPIFGRAYANFFYEPHIP